MNEHNRCFPSAVAALFLHLIKLIFSLDFLWLWFICLDYTVNYRDPHIKRYIYVLLPIHFTMFKKKMFLKRIRFWVEHLNPNYGGSVPHKKMEIKKVLSFSSVICSKIFNRKLLTILWKGRTLNLGFRIVCSSNFSLNCWILLSNSFLYRIKDCSSLLTIFRFNPYRYD